MRKANKILMATVAILLCLVLITTSVASGIFAKFVITKSGEATITFERFGVTVTMTPSAELKTAAGSGNFSTEEVFTNTGYVFTISNIKMIPGMDFTDAVRFEFSGTPTVPVQINITPTVTYSNKVHTMTQTTDDAGKVTTYYNYYVPASTIKNGSSYMSETYYMPIGFTFSANGTTATGNYVLNPWNSGAKTAVEAADIHNAIATGIKSKIANSTCSNNVVTTARMTNAVSFTIGGVAVTGFNMGFAYPLDWPSATDANKEKFDKIATYIAEHTEDSATITVSYKVEIIQVS